MNKTAASPLPALIPTPRTIYVKVSTEILAELGVWSETVRVKIEHQEDDTYEMVFRREPC